MGSTLHFDLAASATRKTFFAQVVQATPNEERYRIAKAVDDESIPAQAQLHDIADVERAIGTTVASQAAKEAARGVYRILAQAEAKVHGCPVEQTHFHEVGLGMTVREVLGICEGIAIVAPDAITSTPIQVGSGTVECSHGILDIPAPATAAIIAEHGLPVVAEKLDGELCTPTSAALIAYFVEAFDE